MNKAAHISRGALREEGMGDGGWKNEHRINQRRAASIERPTLQGGL